MPARTNRYFLRETPEGALPFRPCPRTRSEASYSEPHYDLSNDPPAGVPSARLNHHHAKDCAKQMALISQVEDIIRMTPEQERNAQSERLECRRVDPSSMARSAGDLSKLTKIKVTLLANEMEDEVNKRKKMPGFILDVPRKAPAACNDLQACGNPLAPAEEARERQCKRQGYKHQASTWTWNECLEKGDVKYDPIHCLEGMSPLKIKMHTSVKGEKRYNVCGIQDMLPAATEKFTKGDAPPSARHIYENDKKYLAGFERGCRPKGGQGLCEFLGESPETWGCLAGCERPIDTYRAMKAMEDDRSYCESLVSCSEASFRGALRRDSQASVASSQRRLLYAREDQPEKLTPQARRSVLSTPAGSDVFAGRTSVTSSQRDLTTQRWR